MLPTTVSNPQTAKEAGYWQPYAEFAKTLRTWFVGYGVGALALLGTQQELRAQLVAAGVAGKVGALLLGGVAVQVFITLLYKASMWQLYIGELDSSREETWQYRAADRVSAAYLFELFIDIATIVLFAAATVVAFNAVTSGPPLPSRATTLPVGLLPSR